MAELRGVGDVRLSRYGHIVLQEWVDMDVCSQAGEVIVIFKHSTGPVPDREIVSKHLELESSYSVIITLVIHQPH
jgi:hypothetical protein